MKTVRANALTASIDSYEESGTVNILIKSSLKNKSSKIIQSALSQRGHEVLIASLHEYPAKQFSSISIKNECCEYFASNSIDFPSFSQGYSDVVLWPEREKVCINRNASTEDAEHIALESELFLRSSDYFLGHNAFWVNPLESYARSGLKPVQLKSAKKAGFRIPDTLISNNATDILHFIETSKAAVVAKPFTTINWHEGEELFYFPTTIVTPKDVHQSMEEIQLCPVIYQECIEKYYEIRVTIMGRTIFSAKTNTPQNGKVDQRENTQCSDYKIQYFNLPDAIKEKCFAVMDDLGLVFGCFDLIVDKYENYYFLEVNNSGQFLWKEAIGKGFPMLHVYCEFIESQDKTFSWNGKEKYLLRDIRSQLETTD